MGPTGMGRREHLHLPLLEKAIREYGCGAMFSRTSYSKTQFDFKCEKRRVEVKNNRVKGVVDTPPLTKSSAARMYLHRLEDTRTLK